MDTVGTVTADYLETRIETVGEYKTEDDAKAAFRAMLREADCFHVYEEVECSSYGNRPFVAGSSGRIDFVLSPKSSLITRGWQNGFVGVEVKVSGYKAGPLIAQMMDYSRCAFRLPESRGCICGCFGVVASFPEFDDGRCLRSIMANNRLAIVCTAKTGWKIVMAGVNLFSYYRPTKTIQTGVNSCGYKFGSR